jgi:hypothetical protein
MADLVGSRRAQHSFVERSSEVQETDVSVADGDGREGFRKCLWSQKWNCGRLSSQRLPGLGGQPKACGGLYCPTAEQGLSKLLILFHCSEDSRCASLEFFLPIVIRGVLLR